MGQQIAHGLPRNQLSDGVAASSRLDSWALASATVTSRMVLVIAMTSFRWDRGAGPRQGGAQWLARRFSRRRALARTIAVAVATAFQMGLHRRVGAALAPHPCGNADPSLCTLDKSKEVLDDTRMTSEKASRPLSDDHDSGDHESGEHDSIEALLIQNRAIKSDVDRSGSEL